MVGKPKASVVRLLKLADADKDLQDLVREGKAATSTVLEAIATMPPDEARNVLIGAARVAQEDGRAKARPADVRKVMSAANTATKKRAFGRSIPKELRPHLERLRAAVGTDDQARPDDHPATVPIGILRPLIALVGSEADGFEHTGDSSATPLDAVEEAMEIVGP